MNDVDAQIRVLEWLYDYAEWLGDATPRGVRFSRACMFEMAIDLGVDEAEVDGMLLRLRRLGLAVSGDSGAVVLTDVPRLMDFARFIVARRTEPPPPASGVALVARASGVKATVEAKGSKGP